MVEHPGIPGSSDLAPADSRVSLNLKKMCVGCLAETRQELKIATDGCLRYLCKDDSTEIGQVH